MKYFRLFVLNIIVIANVGSSMGIKIGINYSNHIILIKMKKNAKSSFGVVVTESFLLTH